MISIRELRPEDDLAAVLTLCKDFFAEYQQHHEDFFDTDSLRDSDISDRFLQSMKSDSCATIIALVDNAIVGYASVAIREQPRFYKIKRVGAISGLMVANDHRRKGIATRLLAESKAYFQRNGISYFTVYTAVANPAAVKFYEQNGMANKIYKKEFNKIMNEEYQIVYVEKPEWGMIGGGISNYNKQQAGDDKAKNLCFILQAPDKEIVGGVIGSTYWDWFHLDLMWIKDEFRGHGYGHRLLTLAEQEARQRGAKNVFLDTFSFQAPDFYKGHGYQVFGELENFPTGHQRYFLTKQL